MENPVVAAKKMLEWLESITIHFDWFKWFQMFRQYIPHLYANLNCLFVTLRLC